MAKSTTKLISLKNYDIEVADGGGNSVVLTIDAGSFTFDESKSYNYVKNKGKIVGKLDGDESPANVSFTTHFIEQISTSGVGGVVSIRDLLHGSATDESIVFVSTDDVCNAYAVDIVFTPNAVACDAETITLSKFRPTSIAYNLKARTLVVSGQMPTGPVFS